MAPEVVKQIANDAFISGVVFDGKDLRHFNRWTRNPPVEVRIALEVGEPLGLTGSDATDCGNEDDHLDPHVAGGPTSYPNLKPRCWPCHQARTERDRREGKLTPPDPGAGRGGPTLKSSAGSPSGTHGSEVPAPDKSLTRTRHNDSVTLHP